MTAEAGLLRIAHGMVGATRQVCGTPPVIRLGLLQLLVALSEGAGLALVLPALRTVTSDAPVRVPGSGWVVTGPTALAAVVVVVSLRALLTWVATVQALRIRLLVTDALRARALSALLGADWRFLTSQRRGHVVQDLTTEVLRAGAAVDLVPRLSIGLLVMSAMAAVAWLVAPVVGALAVLAVVLVAAATRRDLVRSGRLGWALGQRNRSLGATVADSVGAARLIRAHDAQVWWERSLGAEAARGRALQVEHARTSAGVRAVTSVAAVVGLVGMLLLAREAGLGTPALVALGVTTMRLLATLQTWLTQAQQFALLAPAWLHVVGFTAEAALHQEERRTPVAAPTRPGTLLSLVDVSVTYPGAGRPAVDGVTVHLPRGGTCAITGPSGAGKSTLLDLVLGLLEPDSGHVLVDGRPMVDLPAWRSRLGYVPQETALLATTVRDNLVWSAQHEAPGDDEVWRALHLACVDDVVRGLPDGLDTVLGDETRLSGGERQRLALARALVRRPDLLVLDEATSALDPGTEATVMDRLRGSVDTVLLVTHRESMVRAADTVVRLDAGRALR